MTTGKGVWTLKIDRYVERRGTVVSLNGRVPEASARLFTAALTDVLGSAEDGVVVDLSGVDYISGAGLQALADASGQAVRAGVEMTCCGLQEPVRLAADLAGLLPDLAIEGSRELALDRLEARRAGRPGR